ncbi:MAG: permease [Planctomycetes bacterium]|nr:permease [Planctomycetota bacterium]
MINTFFWGSLLRLGESLFQAAPTILVGFLVAAVIRRFLGYELTNRVFGGSSRRGLLQAWIIGMLLPVCSLGAIPVIRELRRAGLPGGTILAFALAGPLFNPLSLLYGLTLSQPQAILGFALCSLIVVTFVGAAWDRMFPGTASPEPAPGAVPYGYKRLLSLFIYVSREIVGVSARDVLAGLSGIVLLALILPPGGLQNAMGQDNPLAPLLMTLVAMPAYATPMLAMSQLGMMFQHGNSIGAAFALLSFGAGMNLGTVTWMRRNYGTRPSLVWMGLLAMVVVLLAYGIERPLRAYESAAADHTHAFDIYCRPFEFGISDPMGAAWSRLRQNRGVHELYAMFALVGFVVSGVLLRAIDPKNRIEAWLETAAPATDSLRRGIDFVVPNAVVGGAIVLGIVGASVVGCFAYYPPPGEVFEEMRIARAEAMAAALAGDRQHAEQWIDILDDWTRKLQVGVYLRHGHLSEYHRMKAHVLREKLEQLEHEVAEGDEAAIKKLIYEIGQCYQRMHFAYFEDL